MQPTSTLEGNLPTQFIPPLLARHHPDKQLSWHSDGAGDSQQMQIVRLYDRGQQDIGPAAAALKYAVGTLITQNLGVGFKPTFVLEGEFVAKSGGHGPGTLPLSHQAVRTA